MAKVIFGSIQSRLLFSFMVSAFFVIAVVGVFNQWIRVQLEAEADASLLVVARNIANHIERFNDNNMQSLELGVSLPIFLNYIDDDAETRSDPAIRENAISTLSSMQIKPWDQFYTLSFAILDSDGLNILDTNPLNIGNNERDEPYFQRPMVTGTSTISRLYYLRSRGGAYFYYLVPIRRREAPEPVIGMIRAEVSVSAIQDLLLSMSMDDAYEDYSIALYDPQMVRLVDSEQPESIFRSIQSYEPEVFQNLVGAELLPDLPAQRLLHPMPQLAYHLHSMADEAVFTSNTEDGGNFEQRIAAIRIPELNWYLLVGKPTSQFYMPIQRQTEGLFLLFFTLMVGALGIALLISRSVTVPIRQLTRVATEVAEGNLDTQVPIHSKDEVGQLAETFNQMTRELQHVKSNLEHLVEERTQSLSEANLALKREISERERLEAQNIEMALEAQRTEILSNFIQDASHEFKTPLSIINIKTHLLKRHTDEKLHRYLMDIEQQSHSIEAIVSAMVLMSKLDSMTELELSAIYLDDFLKSVHELENAQFEKSGISLDLELQAGTAAVAINSQMMREAMHRILSNARGFTPAGGSVMIASESNAEWVAIRVQDTGTGMNDDVLSRVFERFFRGDEAHTTRGFGLGLPIAKRIIELSSGEITITSSLVEGTTVIVRLPRSKDVPQSFRKELSRP